MIKKNLQEVLYNSLAQATIRLYLTPHLIHKLFLVVFILCSSSLASFLVIQSILHVRRLDNVTQHLRNAHSISQSNPLQLQ